MKPEIRDAAINTCIPTNLKLVAQEVARREGISLTQMLINGLKTEIQKSQAWVDLLDQAASVLKAN
jgi:hypothetical protein